jgi:hypothetical protein
VKLSGDLALAGYVGKANHFIGSEVWTVEGTYDTELHKLAGEWKITKQKFNFSYESGALGLPAIATDRIKNKT